MSEIFWFWLGTFGMLIGSLSLFCMGGNKTPDEEGHSLAHAFVPLFAAIAYFAMAVGQGSIVLASGREFLFARYLDWSVTTPLLLLTLAMTALHGARRRVGLVAGLLGADIVMIVTGMFFGLSNDPFAKWTWYLTSCIAFLAVYYVLLGPLRREAQARNDTRRTVYTRNLTILSILWLLYPVIVALGPDGLGFWSPVSTTASITVIDLLAKVGYGFIAWSGARQVVESDLLGRETVPTAIKTPAVPSASAVTVPLV